MPRDVATQNISQECGALRRSGVTSASYSTLVVVSPTATLEPKLHGYILRVPLPGVFRYTLKVHLKDDMLIVSGNWEGGNASGAICWGSVYRAVPLPPDAIPAGFETGFEAGSFVVFVPRRLQVAS